ncbi:MAG: PBP1A family penicillin-binding protein [Campylobacterales bacterium]
MRMRIVYGVIIFSVVVFLVLGLIYYRTIHVDLDKLVNYNPAQTTQFVDSKGRLVANIFEGEHRIYVPYAQIPGRLVETLIATEDTAFFEHEGISGEAIIRALIKDIIAGKAVEGASTITQQLIKTTLLTSEKKISRKIKEAIIAMRLEQLLTKEEIIERYLNQIYFGHGYYGIRTAAYGYFHKELKDLTLKEMAMLIGLPKAPNTYDPTRNLQANLTRANSILYRMHSLGWIDDETLRVSLQELPPVYNESLTLNKAPYVVETAIKELSKDFPDIKRGGYRVELTIDLDLQMAAEAALRRGYESIIARAGKGYDASQLNGALMSMDQQSGDVLALVGGVDYRKSPFNRVTQSLRQAGSAMKPFVYLASFRLGYTPNTMLEDAPRSYNFMQNGVLKTWEPKNYDRNYTGPISLRKALVYSKNLATLSLVEMVGMARLYPILESYGFVGLPRNFSIALGSISLSPWKMSEMYTIISNGGVRTTPRLVKSVISRTGEAVIMPLHKASVESAERTAIMIDILRDVVRYGTGTGANVPGIEVAGKTGTTDDYKDAWFCGFTPSTQTVVWYGNDNNKPLPRLTGGSISAPTFANFTRALLTLRPQIKRSFYIPSVVAEDQNGTIQQQESMIVEGNVTQ